MQPFPGIVVLGPAITLPRQLQENMQRSVNGHKCNWSVIYQTPEKFICAV